jgi:hypothetical protein
MGRFKRGDHIAVDRGSYTHHGIYYASNRVFHYWGHKKNQSDAAITTTSLKVFAGGRVPYLVRSPVAEGGARKVKFVLARATLKLGEKKYGLLGNNCEHYAAWCLSGRASSTQVQAFVGKAVASVLATLVATALFPPAGAITAAIGAATFTDHKVETRRSIAAKTKRR